MGRASVQTGTTDRREVPLPPPDGALAEVRGLFGAAGRNAVESFLASRGWTAEEVWPVQASYTPARSCIVRYQVRALNARGHARRASVCTEVRTEQRASVPPPVEFERRYGLAAPVERTGRFLIWAFPYDPSLALLPGAAFSETVKDVLAEGGERPSAVSITPCAYRPRRRAVLKYASFYSRASRAPRRLTFGKVLRSNKGRRVLAAAADLAGDRGVGVGRRRGNRPVRLALPFAHLDERALFFEGARGHQLQELLMGDRSLPHPSRVARVPLEVANLASRDLEGTLEVRPDPLRAARHSADLIAHLVPDTEQEVNLILDSVQRRYCAEDERRSLVHGDLYEAQIFVDSDYSLGLIDLDDLALGDPAMDAANFSAHLIALALTVPGAGRRILAYRSLLRAAFLTQLDVSPAAFAWREALCMLLLASGPFRVLDPAWPRELRLRVELAVRLLQSPARV